MQTNTNQTMIAINKIYSKASESLTKSINKIFTCYVTGGKINPEYAKQLLNEKQTKEYRNKLKALLAETEDENLRREIINTLDAPAYGARISRLEALRDNLYYQARAIGAKEVQLVEDRLVNVIEQSYYRTIYADQVDSGIYDFEIISDRKIQAMLAHEWEGGNYSSRLWNNNKDFADKIAETLEVGCLAGWTLDEMCAELKEHVIGDTSDKRQRFITSRLVRTEVNYFSNQGTLEGLKAAGFTKYRFIATLDLRTSAICRSLDLKEFDIAEAEIGVNLPPMHPFCRSVIVPAYEGENRAGRTRWARDLKTGRGMYVPANMSYDDWYMKFVLGNGLKDIVNNDIMKVAGKSRNYHDFVEYNPNAEFAIHLDNYSKAVNDGLSQACREVAKQGGVDWKEHLVLVDLKTGKSVYTELGNANSVGGSAFWDFVRKNKNGSYAFVHNHNTASKFSETDMRTLLSDNAIDIFVISRPDGKCYVVENNAKTPIHGLFDHLYEEEIKELAQMVKSGEITAGERTYLRESLIVNNLIRDFTKGLKEFG